MSGHALAALAWGAMGEYAAAELNCRLARPLAIDIARSDPVTALNVLVLTSLHETDRGLWQQAALGWCKAVEIADRLGNHRRAEESRSVLDQACMTQIYIQF